MTQILEDPPQVPRLRPIPPSNPTQLLKLPTPPQIATIVLALALIGLFFAPWLHLYKEDISAFDLKSQYGDAVVLYIIPLLAAGTIAAFWNNIARRCMGTITGVYACLGVFAASALLASHGVVVLPLMRWGATFTLLTGIMLVAVSGKGRFTSSVDLVAKKLGSRKAEVYSHWGTMTPEMHFSTQDFYSKLEAAVRGREWPGVQLFRIVYTEAGALSHKREYLRVIRQRQLFDICASTFGRDYFFSVREAEIPSVVTFGMFLVMSLLVLALTWAFVQALGLIVGSLVTVFIVLFAVWILFNILKMGLTRLDSALMQIPVFGTVYEAWFRKETYFQQDSRLIFLQSVIGLVKERVEETVSDKGLTFLSCFERQPILEGLYKRFRIPLGEVALADKN
jgi:hypothetical protein